MTPQRPQLPTVTRTHKLTPADVRTLARLSGEMSERLVWRVSASAIVRALVRYAEQQPASWAWEQLRPFVEADIHSGTGQERQR